MRRERRDEQDHEEATQGRSLGRLVDARNDPCRFCGAPSRVLPAATMSEDPKTKAVELKAPHGARTLEITWADGHKTHIPHEILRGYCPCAHCQGHGGTLQFVPGGNEEIRDIQQIGSYALQFVWGDRHDSGIYTFRYLRSLCQCAECKPNFDPRRAP